MINSVLREESPMDPIYMCSGCGVGPHEVTKMETMTHFIYTIFLPTTLYTCKYSPGHLAA